MIPPVFHLDGSPATWTITFHLDYKDSTAVLYWVKTLAKVKVYILQGRKLLLSHPLTQLIPGKFMLAISSHLLLFHASRNGFQEDLFYNFLRHNNDTVQSVVPWTVPLANFEDGCYISLSPILMDFVSFSEMVKISLTMTSASSLSILRCMSLGLDLMGQDLSRDPWLDYLPLLVAPWFLEPCF